MLTSTIFLLEKMTGVRFDKTINLGHVLTFVGFIATMGASVSILNTRLALAEATILRQEQRDHEQDEAQREMARQMNASMIDTRRSIERLSDKVDAYSARKP